MLYYRLHKNLGTVAGLLRSRPIESRAEREAFYFDRAIANVAEIPLPPSRPRPASAAGTEPSERTREAAT